MTRKMYQFLKSARGNWHNAAYIRCSSLLCPYGRLSPCEGFLMAIDASGIPILVPVESLREVSGDPIDPEECCITISKHAFEAAYGLYAEWHASSPGGCSLAQLSGKTADALPPEAD